jgi:type IV pilus assembly protein PilV
MNKLLNCIKGAARVKISMSGYYCRSRGFSLIEVLVAVIVLSTGLLGLAGLQVTSLRFNHSAYLRSQATLLAYELADRMRANRPTMVANGYNVPNNAVAAGVAACRTAAGCTTAQMATDDIWQWQQALAQLLPNGQGVVCLDTIPVEAASTPAAPSCNGGGTTYAIKVWWDDNRTGDPAQFQRFVVTLTP